MSVYVEVAYRSCVNSMAITEETVYTCRIKWQDLFGLAGKSNTIIRDYNWYCVTNVFGEVA